MLKRYQIELDRNERDFTTFLRSREVTLSKNELRVLIASQAIKDRVSLFEKYDDKNYLKDARLNSKQLASKRIPKVKEKHKWL